MKLPSKLSRDDPNSSKNVIPSAINKKIALDNSADDRDIIAAGVVECVYEVLSSDSTIPDEGDIHIHYQLRNRHQRPGAHVVIHADTNGKRSFVLNGTTKPIDE